MSFKDNFHTGARSPEFACERIIGALADMQYPDGRPIDESQRVMVVDVFQTEKVTRNPEYVPGQLPVKPKFLREWKPYVLVQDRWGNPAYWPCESFLATFVPVNAEAPCEYEVESFLTDGFTEPGAVNQKLTAEGINVVHIDPAQIPVNMRRFEPDEGRIVNDWTVGQKPLVAPVVGRKAVLRNGMITESIQLKNGESTSYPFRAFVGESMRSWCSTGGYFHNSSVDPYPYDIVGLVEEDSHAQS